MARGSVSRGRARQAPARKFVWAREVFGAIVAAQDSTAFNLLEDFQSLYGAQLIGSTIMRVRGLLWFEPTTASDMVGAAGIRTSTESQEATATVDPLEGPLFDLHADWMAFQPVITSTAGLGTDGHIFAWEIDVKSSRKLEELGEGLFLYVSNPIVGVTLEVRGIVSTGLKLP